jgi:hypothetical protein
MTLAEMGAKTMIGQFGEEVTVTSMDYESPDDSDDPIFFDSSGTEGSSETYTVRLYTSPSQEMMEDYGFEQDADSMMYSTENIATRGDKVTYEAGSYSWIVNRIATNQIGEGPYMYIYSMELL